MKYLNSTFIFLKRQEAAMHTAANSTPLPYHSQKARFKIKNYKTDTPLLLNYWPESIQVLNILHCMGKHMFPS